MLLASFEILSDLNNCSSPESAALEEIFNAGWVTALEILDFFFLSFFLSFLSLNQYTKHTGDN